MGEQMRPFVRDSTDLVVPNVQSPGDLVVEAGDTRLEERDYIVARQAARQALPRSFERLRRQLFFGRRRSTWELDVALTSD